MNRVEHRKICKKFEFYIVGARSIYGSVSYIESQSGNIVYGVSDPDLEFIIQ